MLIDCDTCVVRGDACSECVIGVLLRRPPAGTPVDLDAEERAAFGTLAGAGMVPPLRLVPLRAADTLVREAAAGTDTRRSDAVSPATRPTGAQTSRGGLARPLNPRDYGPSAGIA